MFKCRHILGRVTNIANGQTYYTQSISAYLRYNSAINLPIDEFDRKLLYLLSQGCSIKEASNQLNLSISGIEWRQRKLAKIFNLENVRIHALLEKATEIGLI